MVLKLQISTKLFGNAIILKTFLSTISSIIHFFLLSESFVNIIFLQSRK